MVLDWIEGALEKVRAFAYRDAQRGPWRPKIGLALGGGFARGIAHIGVLRVFEQNRIPIDYLAGTSVGALIAAAYAGGSSLDEMERQGCTTRFKDFARWTISWHGFASDKRLEAFLQRLTPVHRFDELRIPLAIAATDLRAGETVFFTEGEIGPALCASCAYPGLFRPVERDGRLLVDGFLTAPVPVEAVRRMGADIVIAVSLGSISPFQTPRNVVEVIGRSFSIVQRYVEYRWRPAADVIIEPKVADFIWDDFQKTPELVAAGAAATLAAIPRIHGALAPLVAAHAADRSARPADK
jgi:NTE family protein